MSKKRCPKCRSKNTITNSSKAVRASKKLMAGALFLPAAFFVGKKKVDIGECFDCGARWEA